MKTKELKELKDKKEADLLKLLQTKRQEWRELRFGSAGSKVRDTNRGRKLRRDIAQILTEIRARSGQG